MPRYRSAQYVTEERLTNATKIYRENVDREAIEHILNDEPVDPIWVTKYRVSTGLISKAGLARMTGYSRQSVIRFERGEKPGPHFIENLRAMIRQLDAEGFQRLPDDRAFKVPMIPIDRAKRVNVDQIVAPNIQRRKCARPDCPNIRIFTWAGQKYCSRKCSDMDSRRLRDHDGRPTEIVRKKHERKPILVQCPNCQHEFPAKGNITNGSPGADGGRKYLRRPSGEADPDGQEQAPPPGLLPELLPDDPDGLQPPSEVQDGRSD